MYADQKFCCAADPLKPSRRIPMLVRRTFVRGLFALALTVALMPALTARAEDKAADASGTWKWSAPGRDGQTREVTLKLKQEGDKLTGTITGFGGNENEITDGKIEGDKISFKVTRKRQDREITISYTATLAGDTLKGKSEMTSRDGQTRTREFEAKRTAAPTA